MTNFASLINMDIYVNKFTTRFFSIFEKYLSKVTPESLVNLLQQKNDFKNLFKRLNNEIFGAYLCDNFVYWLNNYVISQPFYCIDYLKGNTTLNDLCNNFIQFCFKQKISLDSVKALTAFQKHNLLTDKAIKIELNKIKNKETINLLGFGLGDGEYEKSLAKYLIAIGKTRKVILYGYDPYSRKNFDIEYLTIDKINNDKIVFDVIIARWVLHHIELKYRWNDFIKCVNRINFGSKIIIIEHGFLMYASLLYERIYILFTAIFDVITNISLRPEYFLDSPEIGKNFYINYLQMKDFLNFKQTIINNNIDFKVYDIGPDFLNQTICRIDMVKN